VTGSPPTCRVRSSARGARGTRPLTTMCSAVITTTQTATELSTRPRVGRAKATMLYFTTFFPLRSMRSDHHTQEGGRYGQARGEGRDGARVQRDGQAPSGEPMSGRRPTRPLAPPRAAQRSGGIAHLVRPNQRSTSWVWRSHGREVTVSATATPLASRKGTPLAASAASTSPRITRNLPLRRCSRKSALRSHAALPFSNGAPAANNDDTSRERTRKPLGWDVTSRLAPPGGDSVLDPRRGRRVTSRGTSVFRGLGVHRNADALEARTRTRAPRPVQFQERRRRKAPVISVTR
jgi:hypothetical protein